MGAPKKKAVISADPSQLDEVRKLVESGRYRTVSEFVRAAVDEKLARIEEDRIADAVERYVAAGHAEEDVDLIEQQAFEAESSSRAAKRRRRDPR